MTIRKSLLKRLLLAAGIVAAVGMVIAGATLAAVTVTVLTTPIRNEPVYIDLNNNGIRDTNELLGTFPVYDGNEEITFKWTPYTFATGTNGAYRVSLMQDTTPFAAAPTWREIKISHHFADNPNGAQFTLGSFGFGEQVCTICPTVFVVLPETYTLDFNPAIQSYEYHYHAITGAAAMTSAEFMIEIVRTEVSCTFENTCLDYCESIGAPGDKACIDDCLTDLIPFSVNNWGNCNCTTSDAECTAKGGTFIKEVCVCEIP